MLQLPLSIATYATDITGKGRKKKFLCIGELFRNVSPIRNVLSDRTFRCPQLHAIFSQLENETVRAVKRSEALANSTRNS